MWDFNVANDRNHVDVDRVTRLCVCNYQGFQVRPFGLWKGTRTTGLRFVHEEASEFFATRDGPARTSRPREVGKAHFDGPLCHQAIPFEIRRRRELCYRGVWADQRQIPGWDAYVRNWYAWWGFPSRIVNYHNLVAGSESER